jgi:chromosome segregation ATPase
MALAEKAATAADLTAAVKDLEYAKGQLKEWEDRAKSARAALESHEREAAKARLEVDRHQKTFDKVLSDLKAGK